MHSFGGQAASPCATPRTPEIISAAEASFSTYPWFVTSRVGRETAGVRLFGGF
jgi:hypothetical protein